MAQQLPTAAPGSFTLQIQPGNQLCIGMSIPGMGTGRELLVKALGRAWHESGVVLGRFERF